MAVLASEGPPAAAARIGREDLVRLVEYALLAPSSHNTQPWTFAVADGEIRLHVDRDRWLRVADPDQRELYISVGCALENLLIAAARFGYDAKVWYEDNERPDGLAAVVRFREGAAAAPGVIALFDALPLRQTNRRPYDGVPLDATAVSTLQAAVTDDGVQLWLITDEGTSRRLQNLLALAERQQMGDPLFRRELAEWIGQGSFGDSWLKARLGGLVVTHLDLGRSWAHRDTDLMRSAPAVGLLTSLANDRASQMRVGRAFERLALTATTLGVGVQPLSAALELPLTRVAVAQMVPETVFPQHVFRLGYAERERRRSPRRPLAEVLKALDDV